MKKVLKTIKGAILTACILGIVSPIYAQIDPHFSQYYANPLWLNPALTGVVDGSYRVNANFKQQWGGIANSFLTGGVSFDLAPTKNLAVGAMIFNQNAGELNFNYLSALASASYRVQIGADRLSMLNFGIQAGVINRTFDASKARFGSQYNPILGYDSGTGSTEAIANSSSLVPDVNVGVMYFDGNPGKNLNPFIGASVSHLTRPVERFMGAEVKLPMRYTVHGGARIRASEILDLTPNALYLKQGTASEASVGMYAQMTVNTSSTLLFGANYRFEDAAIAYVGFQLKNTVIGVSYDFNTSGLGRNLGATGGLELSLSLVGRNGIIAPNFFCPRL